MNVLTLGWLGLIRPGGEGRAPPVSMASPPAPGAGATNVIVRRQFFSWRELESDDYPTYIANLREIACPEQTIRDIIIADVDALYARKRAQEIVTPTQQWWRSEPDPSVLRSALQKARELEQERRALLVRLLGTNWESGDLVNLPRPSHTGVVLDGPQLGGLPQETQQAIQDVNARSAERMQAYLDAQTAAGKVPDPVEVAKLRQQTRDELARVLSPPELEEFLLRYSQNASDLRADLGQLGYFDATSNEFRMIFRATDGLDQQIQQSSREPTPIRWPSAIHSRARVRMRSSSPWVPLATKNTGTYRTRSIASPWPRPSRPARPKPPPPLYQINLAAQSQQDSIRADTNLTASQKSLQLKQLELDQLAANTLAAGQELPPEPPPLPPALPQRTYVIRPGDTAAFVSLIYGVPLTALRQMNPYLNLSQLRPGDSLIIPPTQFPPPGSLQLLQ